MGFFDFLFPSNSKSSIPETQPQDSRPPIGSMFAGNDREGSYCIVTEVRAKPKRDWDNSMRIDFFPVRSRFSMDMSESYLAEKFTRLSPDEEEKWRNDYFASPELYWKRLQDAENKKYQDAVDAKANAIKKRFDDKKNKYVVFASGNALAFEKILNYATTKGFSSANINIIEHGIFIAVMVKK